MNLLLDTQVVIWWLSQDEHLSKTGHSLIVDAEEVYVSAASSWEMSIKAALGKLRCPDDLEEQLQRVGFRELPVSIAHGVFAAKLPRHHKDPFDRMLVAQALMNSLTLLSSDPQLEAYGARTVLL